MTPVNDQIRASLEDWIRRKRDQHGDAVAQELVQAYLDGVNDVLKIVGEFGAAMSCVLRDVLEGN